MPARLRALLLAALLLAPATSAAAQSPNLRAVRTYPAWSGMPEARFRVTEPIFAERIASLAYRSSFARARLDAIGRSGMRVWVTTPEGLRAIAPRATQLRAGWAAVLDGGRDAVAVVDLRWLERRVENGEITRDEFLADLDLLIGHELFVHVGSIGPRRDRRTLCADPDPVPGAIGCSVVEENLFTHSLDRARPLRRDYRHTPLHADGPGTALPGTARLAAFYFPELEADGWEASPYRAALRALPDLDDDTEFQRAMRELWEAGERERLEGLWGRFLDDVGAGRVQAVVEAELIAEMALAHEPSAGDRFRIRELEFIRAGKHDLARRMARRRLSLTTGRRAVALDEASLRVVREMEGVPLEPEDFVEVVEELYRRGLTDWVRAAYDRYLAGLEASEDEAAVRARVFREVKAWVRAAPALTRPAD